MSWFVPILGNATFISISALSLAAALIYWRAGSFHPVNLRLLRLFLSKEDIVDDVIKSYLSNQSSLAAFRMTSGVPARTLQDAKDVAAFAEDRNIPLTLIAGSWDYFDIKTLSLVEKRIPTKALLLVPAFILVLAIFSSFTLIGLASSDRLLVSLKATKTWLWLGEESASAAALGSSRARLDLKSCDDPHTAEASGFSKTDSTIVCGILREQNLKAHIGEKLPEQKYTSWLALALAFFIGVSALGTIRRWVSAIQLRKILHSDDTSEE